MPTRFSRALTLFLILVIGGSAPAAAEVFCTADGRDPRVEMPATTALPWGAVGYINNGCTATLISQSSILTAGHCVTNTGDASWQQGLEFFPNFHPSETRPSFRIDRSVVGARADVGELDWAIAHLETPVTGFPVLPLADPPTTTPFSVSLGGYGRDLNRTSPKPVPPGASCSNAFCPGGNVWWDAALVQPRCSVRKETTFELLTDCSVVGGNSGSPFILPVATPGSRTPEYRAVGVIHGGSPALLNWSKTAPSRQAQKLLPACTPLSKASDSGNLNGGPSARHFRFAPLFAAGVAVTRSPGQPSRSVVFTSDSDASRIVVRERQGTSLTSSFGDPRFAGFLPRPTRLAGLVRKDGAPAVAAIASNGRLFVNQAADADWQAWTERARPTGVSSLVDIDGQKDELYAVGENGRLYRTRLGDAQPSQWIPLASGPYLRVTVARDADGVRHVFAVAASGRIDELVQDGKDWSYGFRPPVTLPQTSPPRVMADVDAVSTTAGAIQLFALDAGGRPWTRASTRSYGVPSGSGKLAWASWKQWDVRLFETSATFKAKASPSALKFAYWQEVQGPALDGATSVTAYLMPETPAKGVSPITVFVTDRRGNAYSTSRRCVGPNLTTCYWLGWRPFAG